MLRALIFILLLALPALSQTPTLKEVQAALAGDIQDLGELGYTVGEGPTATLQRGEGPKVALWMPDGPDARAILRAMKALPWKGTLICRLGPDGTSQPVNVDVLVSSRPSPTLSPGDVAIPRSEYRSHVDVIHIDVPGPNAGPACAEVLLALRTDLVDPFDDGILTIEKFTVSPKAQITVTLKTYDVETRKRCLIHLERLVRGASPQAVIDAPPISADPNVGVDYSWHLRKTLAEVLGTQHIELDAPVEDDGTNARVAAAWSAPGVTLWYSEGQGPVATVMGLLEIFGHRD